MHVHVRAVYTYVYKDTYSIYFENIYMYLHVHIYIHIIYIIYKYNIFVLNIYMHACVCIYIYIINIHSTHLHYVHKTFILDAINCD